MEGDRLQMKSYSGVVTRDPHPRRRRLWLLLLACCLAAGTALAFRLFPWRQEPTPEPAPAPVPPTLPQPPQPQPSAFERMTFPTDRDLVSDRNRPGAFMPTNPERPESALFGSVRTAASRQGEVASFHEGIDIAPVRRDRKGRPLDSVYAVAAGRIAYINRAEGNSNYGKYVVLLHSDPVGSVYSLYAHLSIVDSELKAGQEINAGAVLGTMGHTSNHGIPLERAHVHVEIGLINNARFQQWFKAQKLKPDHGAYNGWNLLAVDSLDVFEKQRNTKDFNFRGYLAGVPVAFELALNVRKLPDFFERYPKLWTGPAYAGGAVVVRCSEDGLPLVGRNATEAERARLPGQPAIVLAVDDAVLGRNGMHIVGRSNGGWVLASGSKRWLEILTY